jgi:hypothetical protein
MPSGFGGTNNTECKSAEDMEAASLGGLFFLAKSWPPVGGVAGKLAAPIWRGRVEGIKNPHGS